MSEPRVPREGTNFELDTARDRRCQDEAWKVYSTPPDMCPIRVRVDAAVMAALRIDRKEATRERI